MPVIDLTRPFDQIHTDVKLIPLSSGSTAYTGVVYDFAFDSMQSTYIDFPGHILETDDGLRADNASLESLYRIEADVIHLDYPDESGPVTADDLKTACFCEKNHTKPCNALIINALGCKNPRDITERSVFLDDSAVQWVIDCNYRILVSDIYESRALHGVFKKLFENGVTTVCEPVNLFLLSAHKVFLSAIPCPVPNVTQIPCRLFAEF